MITDSQAQEILEAIKAGFQKVDHRFDKLEKTVGSLVVEVASQGQTLKGLVTRDEFNIFKDETLTHFDGLAGQIADLQEAETLRMTAH